MPLLPSYNQSHFRLRNDDGNETGATWLNAEDTNETFVVDTNYRVRMHVLNSGSGGWTSQTWNLYYSLNGGAFTAAASGQPVKLAASSQFAQGDDTTRQLSATIGFISDNNGMCESAGATNSGSANNSFEAEYCIQIDSNYVADADTITLRVYRGTTALNSYSATPSIIVSDSGGGGGISIPVVMHHLRQQGIA